MLFNARLTTINYVSFIIPIKIYFENNFCKNLNITISLKNHYIKISETE